MEISKIIIPDQEFLRSAQHFIWIFFNIMDEYTELQPDQTPPI